MTSPTVSSPTTEQVSRALAGVNDPEIRRPITELGMVKNIDISPDGSVRVDVYLRSPAARCGTRSPAR